MRALLHGCALALLPRRRAGGFPIKLLNYLEAGRPVVAHAEVADGLVHGETAWLLPAEAGPAEWATAILEVLSEPERADALGAAGRRHLLARHAWPDLAKRTLSLLSESGASPRGS
ncbi:MAG: glycosyltransferase [Myxococcales bacterium]|nr:glycosyltransferase [Myxococcales bacterium]